MTTKKKTIDKGFNLCLLHKIGCKLFDTINTFNNQHIKKVPRSE